MPAPSGLIGPFPPGRDPEEYDRLRRRVLWSMPTGLFVVGSRSGDERNLMTANLVVQVATTPKLVAVAVEAGSATERLVQEGGGFSISILARADRAVVRRFVKPVIEVEVDGAGVATAMQGQPVVEVAGGRPVLASAVGWLSCDLRTTVDAIDGPGSVEPVLLSHTLFLGEVVDVGEAEPGPTGAGTDGGTEPEPAGTTEVLRMEDTRMNYGG